MWWLYKIMIMPFSLLLLALMFPGYVVADPAPSSSESGRVFPLEIFDYPEMPASKVSYYSGGGRDAESVSFVTSERMRCHLNEGGYDSSVGCDGNDEDYIPQDDYVKHMRDPDIVHSPGKCLGYNVVAYSIDPGADAHISFGNYEDCHGGIRETGRLDPGYKVTFYGSVCGLTKDHVLACVAYNAHGFVLKPHHQSWTF